MYGIKPRKFRTFSGLFCLNSSSYNIPNEDFRDLYSKLYNYNGELNREDIIKIINSESDIEIINKTYNKNNYKINSLLIRLLKSNITKIIVELFQIEDGLENEDFYEDRNLRGFFNSLFSNEEFSIERDYCDKLDKL